MRRVLEQGAHRCAGTLRLTNLGKKDSIEEDSMINGNVDPMAKRRNRCEGFACVKSLKKSMRPVADAAVASAKTSGQTRESF